MFALSLIAYPQDFTRTGVYRTAGVACDITVRGTFEENVVARTGVCLGLTTRRRSRLSVPWLSSADWLIAKRNCTLIGPTRPWESFFSHVRHLVGAESAATWYLPIARDKELGNSGFCACLIRSVHIYDSTLRACGVSLVKLESQLFRKDS